MKKQNASKLIALTAAATAATAMGGLTVHADTVPESAPVQQQASTVTDEVATQAANTQAENELAADNDQANATDTAATTEKINSVSTAYQTDVNAENQAYQSAVSQASDAHQEAVNQVTANDQAATSQAEAARSAAISAANSDYQSAVDAAAAAKDAAMESAQTAKSAAVSQAQQSAASQLQTATADHQAKIDQQVAANTAAEQAAEKAVNAAEAKTATVTKAAHGITDQSKLTDFGHRILNRRSPRAVDAAYTPVIQYLGGIDQNVTPNMIADQSAIVSSEDQLPMTFEPGIIAYDKSNDHSERIGDQLTATQVAKLNQLNVHWTNQLREYWKNHPELKYVADTSNTAVGQSLNTMHVQRLSTTEDELAFAQRIAHDREAVNYGYNHTGTDHSKPSIELYSHYFKSLSRQVQGPNLGLLAGENMYVIGGSTMLELEVSLYNHLQAMYWGEAENHNGTITSGAHHLQIALTPDMFGAASAFQKTGDHRWIFLTEFVGANRFGASDDDVTAAAHRVQSASPQVSMSHVESITNKQHSSAAQTAVANAKKHLADVKAANKAALDKLKADDPTAGIKQAEQAAINAANKAYDQAVSKATAAYDQAVSAAKAARDQAIDHANKQAVTPDTAAAIKKLDADYQKKLADLKVKHNTKLASLKTAYDQQIAQLKSDLQARIDQRAKALADLKQANVQALADLKVQHQTPTVMPSPDDPESEIITVPGRQTPKVDAPAAKSDAKSDAPAAKDAEEKAKAQAQQATKDAEEKAKALAQAQQPKANIDQSSVVDQWNQNPASKPTEKWKYESQSGPYYQQEVQQAAKDAEEKAKAQQAAKDAEEKAKALAQQAAKDAEEKAKAQVQQAAKDAEEKAKALAQAQQAAKDAEEKTKAQAQAKAEHTYFAQTVNGKVVDEKGHIMVGYTVKGNQVFDAQSKLVGTLTQTSTTRRMANTVKQENAKALPQTGEKQSKGTTVGAILVGLGSLLGLGALGKRKEK